MPVLFMFHTIPAVVRFGIICGAGVRIGRKKEKIMEVNIDNMVIPDHVAIILDGNGRWAKKRGLPRSMGHKEGCVVVERTVEDRGQNWNQVSDCLRLFHRELEAFR